MLFAMGVLKMIPGLVPDIEHVSFLSSLYYARGAAIKEFSDELFDGCFPFYVRYEFFISNLRLRPLRRFPLPVSS